MKAMPYLRQLFKEMKTIKNKPRRAVPANPSLRPFKEAWDDIETSLRKIKPHFKSVKEAMAQARRRPSS